MSLRILIADDHGLLRAGLRSLLSAEPDLQVVGEAADGHEALHLAGSLRPDLVLMDISMPGPAGGGIEATRQLIKLLPQVLVLILTVHEDTSLLREAIQAGASGYILKRAVEAELIDAIHVISRGDMYIHPSLTRALLTQLSPAPVPKAAPREQLTSREIDVLRLIVQGYTNRQIAEELNLGVRTVESHRANLMGKLNLRSRVELVRYVTEHGLLDSGQQKPDS